MEAMDEPAIAPRALAELVDVDALEQAMRERALGALLVTSRHNVAYFLGGHRFFFFDGEDALGLGRYTPVLGYVLGEPDSAFYLANMTETHQFSEQPIWVQDIEMIGWPGADLGTPIARRVSAAGLEQARIGIEAAFLPTSVYWMLRTALPGVELVDVHGMLEELRLIKRPDELDLLRRGSELIVESMLAAWDRCFPGVTTKAVECLLREEEAARGLIFDHCLTTTGTGDVRSPGNMAWTPEWPLNLDSGGRLDGYVGDLSRNAVFDQPTAVQTELLDEVETIQQAVRDAIRPGTIARELYGVAREVIAKLPHGPSMQYAAHGLGMINHEAPRISNAGPVVYPAVHRSRPLAPGMVLSIETALAHPEAGYMKLEDTIFVTADGHEAVGDTARGWNRVSSGAR